MTSQQVVLCFLCLFLATGLSAQEAPLQEAMQFFARQYPQLEVPGMILSYQDRLNRLQPEATLNKQQDFFTKLQSKLSKIDQEALNAEQQLEYEILQYQCAINLERLQLSIAFVKGRYSSNDRGIYHQQDGRAWYRFLVKQWTSGRLTPDEIAAYGREEVKRIKAAMAKIERETLGFSIQKEAEHYFTTDNKKVFTTCVEARKKVANQLFIYFPDFPDLPEVQIQKGRNPALARVPGFYNNNTFYYNLFSEPFDLRQVDWLFIHEGNPGHHFQFNYERMIEVPAYRSGMSYIGFKEGWAAYVENLGEEVGLYQTPYHWYSKWEWDLIRSVRLMLDVGINYEGWTNEEALAEWKKYIEGQDAIGRREIDRMRRWPAQVLSYKVGEKAIIEVREELQRREGAQFDLKDFHTQLLSQRTIPVQLINKLFI